MTYPFDPWDMAGNVYNQYVWLLELIARHNGITFKEISDHWQRSALNYTHTPLARRTFRNHLDKIAELFEIDIVCGSNYKYHIQWAGDINLKQLQQSMLAHLQLSNALFVNPRLTGRISLDDYLSFRYYMPLIQAMEAGAVVEVHLFNRTADEHHYLKVAPYYIKQFESGWFVVGRELTSGSICAYSFAEIVAVRESVDGEKFELPTDFSPADFMRSPQLDTSSYNNNAQYMECLHQSRSRIRRGRWGSFIPEGYEYHDMQ